MEILRFLKWQWKRFDSIDKLFLFITINTLICIIINVFLAYSLTIIILSIICTIIATIAIFSIIEKIILDWRAYIVHKNSEAQKIIEILQIPKRRY